MEEIAHALASLRRLAILEALLARHEKASQSELRQELDIPETQRGTLNKDIGVLERAGLLTRDGEDSLLSFPAVTARALQALAELTREVSAERAHVAAKKAKQLQATALREETRRAA